MIKSVKVMLLPNNKQKTKLFKYADTARFAYNWAIAREQENYKNGGKFICNGDLRKEFTQLKKTEDYKWLRDISNNVCKHAIMDACDAYKRFFNGICKPPKFKTKKNNKQGFFKIPSKLNLHKPM